PQVTSTRDLLSSLSTTPTPTLYTLSLHDALPISGIFTGTTNSLSHTLRQSKDRYTIRAGRNLPDKEFRYLRTVIVTACTNGVTIDRKSTRLNSSHEWISYAVFCLKKKTT